MGVCLSTCSSGLNSSSDTSMLIARAQPLGGWDHLDRKASSSGRRMCAASCGRAGLELCGLLLQTMWTRLASRSPLTL